MAARRKQPTAPPAAEKVSLDVPQVSIELTPGGILVRCGEQVPSAAALLAACLDHAAAQLRLLSAAAVAQHGRDATVTAPVAGRPGVPRHP